MRNFLLHHPADLRLGVSMLAGLIAYFGLRGLPPAVDWALAWDAGACVFLGLTASALGGSGFQHFRKHAGQNDVRAWIILTIVVVASAASLASLALVMQKAPGTAVLSLGTRVSVTGVTLFLSWIVLHTVCAIRYAHSYYDTTGAKGKSPEGLAFPGKDEPDFWDFLYYAFVVGMTCQVSDVQITGRPMRRMTLAHGVISFFFNAGVLALAVNIFASLL